MSIVTITGLAADEGTVVLFDAIDEHEREVIVVLDHGPAEYVHEWIIEHGPLDAEVEDWAVV